VNPHTQNSMLDPLAADAAALLSMLLQHGALAAKIGHALRRIPDGASARLIGAVVDAAIRWDSSPGDVINAPVAGPIPLASLCEVPPLKTRLAARGYPTSRA
jgi:hypothetical protein